MKAFILAAGLGTRLHPLTDNQPKVMVEVLGQKILERTVKLLQSDGVNELVVNTHYFPEVVFNYFGDGAKWGVKITYSHEPIILGTAGGLKKVEQEFANEKEFLVVYGDNVFDLDLKKFVDQPLAEGSKALIMLFDRTKNANSGMAGGVVEINGNNEITGFYEGMNRADLSLVNAGVYKLTPEIFNFIPGGGFADFGKEVFPQMLEQRQKLQSYLIAPTEAVFGVDTKEGLEKTEVYLKQGSKL